MSVDNNKKRKEVPEEIKADGVVVTIEKLEADTAMLKQHKAVVRAGIQRAKVLRNEHYQGLSDLEIVDGIKKPKQFSVDHMTARDLTVSFMSSSGKERVVRRTYVDGKLVQAMAKRVPGPSPWLEDKKEGASFADAYAKAVAESCKEHPETFDAIKVVDAAVEAALAELRN